MKSVCSILAPTNENTSNIKDDDSKQPDESGSQADDLKCDGKENCRKPDVPELLKPLNFQQVTGCTFNIHLNLKQ